MRSIIHIPESGKKTRERRTPKISPRTTLMAKTCRRITMLLPPPGNGETEADFA